MSALDSLYNRNAAQWGPIYEAVKDILGDTGTILPIGDIRRGGQPNATTFTTTRRHASGVEAVFTWGTDASPALFDTKLDLTDPANWQGIIPFVTFNGTDEEADTPDATYWSRNDAAAEGFSVGAWVNIAATAGAILAKYDTAVAVEWETLITSSKWYMDINDNSVPTGCSRITDATVAFNTWLFLVATYSGVGGASAGDGITLYENGAVRASTATNSGTYVAMENLTARVTLGHRYTATPTQFFNGKMAGGPLGPFFVQAELSAAAVKRLYECGRDAMAL